MRALLKRLEAVGRQLEVTPDQPVSLTDPFAHSMANGRFDKRESIYEQNHDRYRCPAGEHATWRLSSTEKGMVIQ